MSSDVDLRERLINAAIGLLQDEGPQALQARVVAAKAGASTMAVYSRFGGMDQLVQAVIETGLRQVGADCARVPRTGDPVADVTRVGLTYRDCAQSNPHLFDLMYGLSYPGSRRSNPRVTTGDALDDAYAPLVEHVQRAIDAGRLRPQDAHAIAAQLWSFVHGFVALELAGFFSHLSDSVREVFGPLNTAVMLGLGDDADRAALSTDSAINRHRTPPKP